MIGWLITNKYIVSDNFLILKDLILTSAKKHNVDMHVYDNIEIISVVSKKDFIRPDFILFWDKDVKLAYYLESIGLKLFNSAESIRICDDKSLTYLKLLNSDIKQPKTIFSPLIYYHSLTDEKEFINFTIKYLSFSFVYKDSVGSFGKQVYLVKNEKEFIERINYSGTNSFICQEYIKSSKGKDLRIYVVGDKVVAAMKRENKSGDFRANIELGGVGTSYEPNEKQVNMALKAVKSLNLDFAGVDILFGENDTPILCEVNSNAYFVGINNVTNCHIEDYIFDYILNKL